jgi:IS30 family transposase
MHIQERLYTGLRLRIDSNAQTGITWWNWTPRKCLGCKTPFEVFAKMTGKDYFLNGSVALMG